MTTTSETKLTKVEQRWRWLAHRIWPHGLNGWSSAAVMTAKLDALLLLRRVAEGHVEKDGYGMYRLTDVGRAALADDGAES